MSSPTITLLDPSQGPIAGSQDVTITGTNLADVTAVTFGTNAATNVNALTDGESLTCTTPANTTASTVEVVAIAGNYGTIWTQTSAPTPNNWTIVAMSSNGQYQTAVIFGGFIYTSADYGASWNHTLNDSIEYSWSGVAMSSNGQYQTACVDPGGIYTSSDYGATWSNLNNGAPSVFWNSVAMSSNGQYQTATSGGGVIYTSSNYGAMWNNTNDAPPAYWNSVAMSSNGQYQTALAVEGGIYTSSDYGQTWKPSDAPYALWAGVAMSSDGQYQTAVILGGFIYTSADYGASWNHTNDSIATDWLKVAMSSDGQYQTATNGNGGFIYTSADYGASWNHTLNDSIATDWTGVAMSSDGLYQTALIYNGGIYTANTISSNSLTYTYESSIPTPTIESISPTNGPTAGGQTVTITGTNLSDVTSVTFGGNDATNINIVSSTKITCITPAGTAGLVIVTVTDSNSGTSDSLDYTYTKVVISSICFPAGTPITTDQGNIPIDKINPEIHTIHNNPIVAITKTITQDTHLVCFEKHSLGLNKPNKKTVTSKNHKVYYNGKMTKAYHFVKQFKNVTEIEYNGEILYNVLMEKYDKLKANNLTFETLDPKNIIAKLYTSNFDEEYKDNIIVMINNSIMQNDHRLYQNIINRVVNDKSLSTCFDEEPEYEYEEPEYEYEEPVNTTRIDTIHNYVDKPLPKPVIDFKVKVNLENNTHLHGKLTKYIKAQQSKDNQESEVVDFKVTVNLENNTHLQSKLNKYTKMYQNKDDIDEIVKKKEFINLKKEEKEERERQKLIEAKNKMTQPVVEKSKTYKRVNLFKKTGTSKRLF